MLSTEDSSQRLCTESSVGQPRQSGERYPPRPTCSACGGLHMSHSVRCQLPARSPLWLKNPVGVSEPRWKHLPIPRFRTLWGKRNQRVYLLISPGITVAPRVSPRPRPAQGCSPGRRHSLICFSHFFFSPSMFHSPWEFLCSISYIICGV